MKAKLTFKRMAALPVLCGALLLCPAGQLAAQTPAAPAAATATTTLTIHVTGLRNATGKICAILFQDGKGFPLEFTSAVATKQVDIDAQTMSAKVVFEKIPQGAYAIAVLHDENLNSQMDFDSQGIPLEGYGISNNPPRRDAPPSTDEAMFTAKQAEVEMEIKLIYWQ
ncbi:MAG: DUF2141 domain-containing protein [Terracidiphilus sp.]|nr:DUF2141 domain-containing protein [Terracidiphilus sp.]MDR3775998.1 DUF2141 domain-containing protein [Terracidiphilus sp.]